MHTAINVLDCVVNRLMIEVSIQSGITPQLISVERGTCLDMLLNDGLQGFFLPVSDDLSVNPSATFQHSHYDYFVLNVVALSGNTAFFHALVHVPCFATNESFIGFHFATIATQFQKRAATHSLANSVQHEPSGFLSYADSAVNLVRANTVLAAANHPHGHNPFFERQGRVLENGSNLDAELPMVMLCFAFPDTASRDVGHIFAAAGWTNNAIRPTQLDKELNAGIRIGEVLDCLLQGFWGFLFHDKTRIAQDCGCVKYIIAQNTKYCHTTKYFACGWCTTMAEVDCSGSMWKPVVRCTPMVSSGLSTAKSFVWSSRLGHAGYPKE